MCFDGESAFRTEEANEIRSERVVVLRRSPKFIAIAERVLASGIERPQVNRPTLLGSDAAGCLNGDSNVHDDRVFVEEVQRPEIYCASGEIYATRTTREYGLR